MYLTSIWSCCRIVVPRSCSSCGRSLEPTDTTQGSVHSDPLIALHGRPIRLAVPPVLGTEVFMQVTGLLAPALSYYGSSPAHRRSAPPPHQHLPQHPTRGGIRPSPASAVLSPGTCSVAPAATGPCSTRTRARPASSSGHGERPAPSCRGRLSAKAHTVTVTGSWNTSSPLEPAPPKVSHDDFRTRTIRRAYAPSHHVPASATLPLQKLHGPAGRPR